MKEDPTSIRRARDFYKRALSWTLRHRRDAVLVALACCLTILYPMEHIKRSDSSNGESDEFRIRLYPPKDFTSAQTGEILAEIEDFLESKQEEYGIRTTRVYYRSTYGNIHVFLDQRNDVWWFTAYRDLRKKLHIPVDKRMNRKEVIEDINDKIPRFVGVRTTMEGGSTSGGPGVSLLLWGDDTEVLAGLIGEVERRLLTVPSVISVLSDLERADDEVQVHINRDLAQKFGISPRAVGRSIGFALQLSRITSVTFGFRQKGTFETVQADD